MDERTFLARQPILDAKRQVFGYELLFRSAPTSQQFDGDPEAASASVISNALLGCDLDTVTKGKQAFINLTRGLLLDGIPEVLPPGRVVLEVTEDIAPDPDVLAACERLRAARYQIALDNFVLDDRTAAFVPLADFIKVDFMASSAEDRGRIAKVCSADGPVLVAQKVETNEMFDEARGSGYEYFQGYFFGKPEMQVGGPLPANQLQLLRLLGALQDPDLSVSQLEGLVKTDARLCYLVLRTVNSAAFGLRSTVTSIGDAVLMLGRDTIRRWVSLWVVAGIGSSVHPETVSMAVARARGCELLVQKTGGDGGHGFLIGMCSMLDAVLARPMEEILEHLPLEDEDRAALLGETNATRHLLDTLINYERGNWDACLEHARQAGVDPQLLAATAAEGLAMAHQLTSGSSGH